MPKILLVVILMLISCASYKPLDDRGVSREERVAYVKNKNYPEHIKKAFIEKEIKPGQDKEMVRRLFGKPNTAVGDSIWYYQTKLSTLLRVEFNSLGKVESLSY